jgi:hypothetical protein
MRVLDEADLDSSVGDFISELEEAVRTSVKESPLLTFAAAGTLGYVLGGGLTVGVLTRAVQIGFRVVLANRAKQALGQWLNWPGDRKMLERPRTSYRETPNET